MATMGTSLGGPDLEAREAHGGTDGERRCWRYAYDAALAAGRTREQAEAYAAACLQAYRMEAD